MSTGTHGGCTRLSNGGRFVTEVHDWRLIEENSVRMGEPIEGQTDVFGNQLREWATVRRWYCTRCRLVDATVESQPADGTSAHRRGAL